MIYTASLSLYYQLSITSRRSLLLHTNIMNTTASGSFLISSDTAQHRPPPSQPWDVQTLSCCRRHFILSQLRTLTFLFLLNKSFTKISSLEAQLLPLQLSHMLYLSRVCTITFTNRPQCPHCSACSPASGTLDTVWTDDVRACGKLARFHEKYVPECKLDWKRKYAKWHPMH